MELLTWIAIAISGITGAVVAHVLSRDLYAGVPALADRILRRAARQLPMYLRKRYEEEWLAHLNDCNGVLPKLLHAGQCLLCARHLGKFHRERRIYCQFRGHGMERGMELDLPTAIVLIQNVSRVLGREAEGLRELRAHLQLGDVDLDRIDLLDADPNQLRPFAELIKEVLDRGEHDGA